MKKIAVYFLAVTLLAGCETQSQPAPAGPKQEQPAKPAAQKPQTVTSRLKTYEGSWIAGGADYNEINIAATSDNSAKVEYNWVGSYPGFHQRSYHFDAVFDEQGVARYQYQADTMTVTGVLKLSGDNITLTPDTANGGSAASSLAFYRSSLLQNKDVLGIYQSEDGFYDIQINPGVNPGTLSVLLFAKNKQKDSAGFLLTYWDSAPISNQRIELKNGKPGYSKDQGSGTIEVQDKMLRVVLQLEKRDPDADYHWYNGTMTYHAE